MSMSPRTIHVGRNGQSLGTFPEVQILAMLQAGQLLPTDIGWTEGMAQWLPLGQMIHSSMDELTMGQPPVGESSTAPLPALPAGALNYMTSSQENGELRPLPWKKVLSYAICVTICLIGNELIKLLSSPVNPSDAIIGLAFGLSIFLLISYILMVIYGAILHYRCWLALPLRFRYLSPGLAVGLIFIPIFNWIWIFFMYHRLARGYRDWGNQMGHRSPTNLPLLATLIACLWDISWLGWININSEMLAPQLDILTAPGLLILYIFFYRGIIRQAHAIHGH